MLTATATGHAGGRLACGEITALQFPITAVASLDVGGKGAQGSVELMQLDAENLQVNIFI